MKTAAAFAKGLLELEGSSLTPVMVGQTEGGQRSTEGEMGHGESAHHTCMNKY